VSELTQIKMSVIDHAKNHYDNFEKILINCYPEERRNAIRQGAKGYQFAKALLEHHEALREAMELINGSVNAYLFIEGGIEETKRKTFINKYKHLLED
jgi:hypothetical protein